MLKGRLPQNVNAVPLKVSKPLALRNKLYKRDQKDRLAGICIAEFSQLLVCLKNYSFNQEACSKEVQLFQNCYNQHETAFKNRSGGSFGGKMSTAAINKMLGKVK